jgi:hypothetical protein
MLLNAEVFIAGWMHALITVCIMLAASWWMPVLQLMMTSSRWLPGSCMPAGEISGTAAAA